MQYYILSQTNFNPPSQPSPMEVSSIRGLSELGIEDPTTTSFSQWHMNPADDFSILPFPLAAALGGDSFSNSNFDLKNHLEASQTATPKPAKQMKTNAWNPQDTFSSATLSFVNSDHTNPVAIVKPKEEAAWPKATAEAFPCDSFISQNSFGNQNYVLKACQGAKRGCPTGARLAHTQDHIIAERKRRERLSQRFIALSAIVPGLKKMDKASVLGDAIKYLKQLQERVRILEEQTNKKTTESVVFVKKSQLFAEGDESCSDEALPEIEARFSERSVLIRIHCEKRKGVLERTVEEIEKWHLSVTNSSVITFGSSALDITILAQMDMEFLMTAEDLVKNLRSAFQLFM